MDKGKVSALHKAGWSEDKIANEMQVDVEKVRRAISQIAEKDAKTSKQGSEPAEERTIVCLTGEDLDELFERAAQIGARTGIEKYQEELKSTQKRKADKKLHNTKLLLRNYRMLEIHSQNSVFRRAQMSESPADILERMMTMSDDELVVESIRKSAARTAVMVSHINTMLDMFKICCERSSNELDERRYEVIHGLYIADPKITRKELAQKWNVSVDTTYSDEKIAIERLSALLFGVDGL